MTLCQVSERQPPVQFPTMETHAWLQSYADTIHRKFPLVLAIGREPNTDLPISGDHGLYDFDAAPRCAFWNVSYGLLGSCAGLTVRELKDAARRRRSAPIIYADSLPIGLKNEIVDKRRHRFVDEALVQEHISRIFGFRTLLDRVRVVLVSGLNDDVFRSSVSEIRQRCIHLGMDYAEMPFFYPTNSPKIRESLTNDVGVSLKSVMQDFLAIIPAR